jgi:transglutaminase-like putative cysteine protease
MQLFCIHFLDWTWEGRRFRFEAYLGEAGWVAFDPTNHLLGSERHIHVAVGRDYADVPPARGRCAGRGPQPPATVLRTKRPEPKTAGSMDLQQQQQQ